MSKFVSVTEKAKMIRSELKKQGLKNVSVRSSNCGYSDSINITIKDLTVNKKQVEEIANQFESIRRCEYSGEILQGCNTYIIVEYDYMVLSNARDEFLPQALKIINEFKDQKSYLHEIAKNDESRLLYDPSVNLVHISYNDNRYSRRHVAYNEYDIARSLCLYHYCKNFD